MAQEKTFDRADLLRFFHETERDGLVGRLAVIHPVGSGQLAFDQDGIPTETRRYPIIAETTALYCERYGFSVLVQRVSWPDGGDQYLHRDHPLRVLTRERRAITRYGGSSSQLSRWAAELADEYRQEIAALIPADAIDLLAQRNARREDAGGLIHVNARCAPLADLEPDGDATPDGDPAPADPLDALIEGSQEESEQQAVESDPDPDHDASGETLDDLLSGFGEQEE